MIEGKVRGVGGAAPVCGAALAVLPVFREVGGAILSWLPCGNGEGQNLSMLRMGLRG